jgi:hypothetical protein
MPIRFTGAGSFSGYWFVRELVAAGDRAEPAVHHFSAASGRGQGLAHIKDGA